MREIVLPLSEAVNSRLPRSIVKWSRTLPTLGNSHAWAKHWTNSRKSTPAYRSCRPEILLRVLVRRDCPHARGFGTNGAAQVGESANLSASESAGRFAT